MGVKGRARQGDPESLVWEDLPLTPLSACRPQARDRKMVGDLTGAQSFASTARCLNIWALVLGLLLTIISIVLLGMAYAAAYGALLQAMQESGRYH